MQLKRIIRIYPNQHQREQLSHWFGQTRYSYNYFLKEKKKRIPNSIISKSFTTHRKETDFLQDVPRSVQVCAMRNANTAFTRFFKKQSKYPRFKNKSKGNNCQIQLDTRHAAFLKNWNNNILQIPGVGIVSFRDNEKLKELASPQPVISLKKKGSKYFCCYGYVANDQLFPPCEKIIGLDLGLTHFIIDSDGNKITNPRKLRMKSKYLKRQQRILSRRKIAFNNRVIGYYYFYTSITIDDIDVYYFTFDDLTANGDSNAVIESIINDLKKGKYYLNKSKIFKEISPITNKEIETIKGLFKQYLKDNTFNP